MHVHGRCKAIARLNWTLLAAAALLAGCAAQPKGDPTPQPEARSTPPAAWSTEVTEPGPASEPEAAPPSEPEGQLASAAAESSSETGQDEPARNEPPRTQEDPETGTARHTQQTASGESAKEPPADTPAKEAQKPASPQEQTSAAQPQAPADAKPEERTQEPKTAQAAADAKDAKKSGGCGSKGKVEPPTPSPAGPQPLWVCEQPKCVIEPVWRGQKAEFVFTIGNQGEGDLRIRVKGG